GTPRCRCDVMRLRTSRRAAWCAVALTLMAGCTRPEAAAVVPTQPAMPVSTSSTQPPAATLASVAPPTARPSTAVATTTSTTTTTTTTVPPTTAPLWSAPLDLTQPVFAFGSSVEGRALVAERYGELGGRRVLVIGVIHGNEDAGVAIIDELRATPPPP